MFTVLRKNANLSLPQASVAKKKKFRYAEGYKKRLYNIGDKGLLLTLARRSGKSEKLLQKFVGVFVIRRCTSPLSYEVLPPAD